MRVRECHFPCCTRGMCIANTGMFAAEATAAAFHLNDPKETT
jgi:hypothetical protein